MGASAIVRVLARALVMVVLLGFVAVAPLGAATTSSYVCAGDPLEALADNGAVDDPGIPNQATGTVPGAFVVLRWRGLSLQLPRTNNAGAPSYTDGQWWWSLEDPEHPSFRLRHGLGDVETFACQKQA